MKKASLGEKEAAERAIEGCGMDSKVRLDLFPLILIRKDKLCFSA